MSRRIVNHEGELLDHDWSEGASGDAPVVVIGHGVTANKDRDWAVALARAVAGSGRAALRFSFSGNGASEGRFERSTVTKEVADLGTVLDTLEGRRIVYAGHSMGGAVGVLRAAEDERIQALVSLAGMVHTADFAERKFGDLTPGDDLMWDKPECPLSPEFMDDMRRIGSVLDRAAAIRVPWLLVHGTDDTVVPHEESVAMRSAATSSPSCELVSLEGADHLFSEHEEPMARIVVDWLERLDGGAA